MSKNNKDQNSIFIIIVGIIICIGRFGLGQISFQFINNEFILVIMAIINYVALGFVLVFLIDDLKNDCQDRISNAGLTTDIKKKCVRILKMHKGIFLCIYFLFGIFYMLELKSSEWNDVLSIFALAVSIANNGVVNDFGKSFYIYILNLSKKSFLKLKRDEGGIG